MVKPFTTFPFPRKFLISSDGDFYAMPFLHSGFFKTLCLPNVSGEVSVFCQNLKFKKSPFLKGQ